MSPTYKLTYFNGRGRGEVIRMLFAYAGVEYEDKRLVWPNDEEWQKLKSNTPFGLLPILDVDGKVIAESKTIERYLANKFNLRGDNEWEATLVDMIVDCADNTFHPYIELFGVTDPEEKEKKRSTFEKETYPSALEKLEKLIASNGEGKYFVGSRMSWADIHLFHYLSMPADVKVDFTKYPKLKAMQDRVASDPKIKEWLEKRPASEF